MKHGKKGMSRSERMMWESAQTAMKTSLRRQNCEVFMSDQLENWALCCRVNVWGPEYGLCAPLSVLDLTPKNVLKFTFGNKKKGLRTKRRKLKKMQKKLSNSKDRSARVPASSVPSTTRFFDSISVGSLDEDELTTLFVDLFDVPCYPPIDNGLCSQFVRSSPFL